jgi:glycosyltransferase involved in cell wall biosynthesis
MSEGSRENCLLTIGIPTFNRAASLRHQLERIEQEIPENSAVEVLVSDNASRDETEEMVKALSKSAKFELRYNRNSINLGYDGNIIEIYNRARGLYVWFLSDDDIIVPGGIRELFRAVEENSSCGVIVNNIPNGLRDGDLSDIAPYNPCGVCAKIRVGAKTTVSLDEEIERMVVVKAACQKVSTCVVQKQQEPIPKGNGGGNMHERIANLTLLRNPSYFITALPVVSGGPSSWSTWFMEAVMFGIRELYQAPDMRYSKEITDLMTVQTCKIGLGLLAVRYKRAIQVSYPEVDDVFVNRLKLAYGGAYQDIESLVVRAVRATTRKRADRILFLLYCPFYFGWKIWGVIIFPKGKKLFFASKVKK